MSTPNRRLARSAARQRGAALIVALIMLVVVALLGIGAIQSSMTGLRLSRNAQFSQQAQLAAQRAIDAQITNLATFTAASTAPATATVNIDVDLDGTDDFSVVTDRPRCLGAVAAEGYSYEGTAPPRWTTWAMRAVATEIGGSTSAEITQGIRVLLPVSAECPA
jgi:Tfp pilus assembly protein PilX